MSKRIEKLTAAQWDRVYEERERWRQIGLCTDPADRLQVKCGTGRAFALPVPPEMTTPPLVAWLEVHDVEDLPNVAGLVHERSFDTHETLELPPGKYQARRQREYSPEGWRRVAD